MSVPQLLLATSMPAAASTALASSRTTRIPGTLLTARTVGSVPAMDGMEDACPHCDEPVAPAEEPTATGWERGSCRACGLQTVRPPGEAWRAIRG